MENSIGRDIRLTITGITGSGKDTIAQQVCSECGLDIEKTKLSNSQAIKRIAKILLDNEQIDLDDQENKKKKLSELGCESLARGLNINTVRELLIAIGDGAREALYQGIWASITDTRAGNMPTFIKTDDRYPQELQSSWNHDAVHIHVINRTATLAAIASGSICKESENWAASRFASLADIVYFCSGDNIAETVFISRDIKRILLDDSGLTDWSRVRRKELFDLRVENAISNNTNWSIDTTTMYNITDTVKVLYRHPLDK